ncbi:DUF5110 domain-containing protein [Nonomuraea sp. 10N515B]|uniref:DUF5110 domain-containing protein n=1 Tax=Nonomuraea sp. 10N515B TaxID=3457422 RepID=UPI003FCD102E
MRAAAGAGVIVSYDPNIRPSLIGDRASALTLVEECVRLSRLVKVSAEDLAWLYPGEPDGTTQQVTTGWDAMPVFIKSGGILASRADNVTNDVQNPLNKVSLTVAGGANGQLSLYEDDGHSTDSAQSATTAVRYTEDGGNHRLSIAPVHGRFRGQVTERQWTLIFRNADAPTIVQVDGQRIPATQWSYDQTTRTLTVTTTSRPVNRATTVSYR